MTSGLKWNVGDMDAGETRTLALGDFISTSNEVCESASHIEIVTDNMLFFCTERKPIQPAKTLPHEL